MAKQNLIGLKNNKLTVIEELPQTKQEVVEGRRPILCQCECGNIIKTNAYNFKSGHTKSCGCIKIKHGFAGKERLYTIWQNMKKRCDNTKDKRYNRYGGRGISVCKEWNNDYSIFRNWAIENGYHNTLTIDRINNNGNYEPSNCRWATTKQQANNTSRNHYIELNNKNNTISEWADILGINYSTIRGRIRKSVGIDTPLRYSK